MIDRPTILYDGVCNLCSGLIRTVRSSDRGNTFDLVSLQSSQGKSILGESEIGNQIIDSVVLIDKNGTYIKSKAIFRIASLLGGVWKLMLIFNLLPDRYNDRLYDFIAKYRYKIFGQKKECLIAE